MKICGACETENDETRVFCLKCAKRLPLPAGPSKPGLPAKTTETLGVSTPKIYTHQTPEVPAKLRQAGTRFSTIVCRFLFLLAIGFAVLAVYLMLQPPLEVPPPVPPITAEDLTRLTNFLRDASKSPSGAWQIDEKSINAFLTENVRRHPVKNPLGIEVVFDRCFATLRNGEMDFTIQFTSFERNLFLKITLAPTRDGSRVGFRVVKGTLGRMPIPGPLAHFLLPLLSPCFGSLGSVLPMLKSADSAEASPKRIVFRWPASSSR